MPSAERVRVETIPTRNKTQNKSRGEAPFWEDLKGTVGGSTLTVASKLKPKGLEGRG